MDPLIFNSWWNPFGYYSSLTMTLIQFDCMHIQPLAKWRQAQVLFRKTDCNWGEVLYTNSSHIFMHTFNMRNSEFYFMITLMNFVAFLLMLSRQQMPPHTRMHIQLLTVVKETRDVVIYAFQIYSQSNQLQQVKLIFLMTPSHQGWWFCVTFEILEPVLFATHRLLQRRAHLQLLISNTYRPDT